MEDNKIKAEKKKTASPLVAAAKALGNVAGKVASTLGVHEESAAPPTPAAKASSPTIGKLPKKNKSRLPRKEKKALKRKAQTAK